MLRVFNFKKLFEISTQLKIFFIVRMCIIVDTSGRASTWSIDVVANRDLSHIYEKENKKSS